MCNLNRIGWIASILVLACGAAQNWPEESAAPVDVATPASCTLADGSNACDGGPVYAQELEGTWCEDISDTSRSFCLTIWKGYNPDGTRTVDGRMSYVKSSQFCTELGHASGGLEFWPEWSNCDGTDLHMYGVSVDRIENDRIAMFYDDRHVEYYAHESE